MTLPIVLLLLTILILGLIAAWLSIRNDQLERFIREKKERQKNQFSQPQSQIPTTKINNDFPNMVIHELRAPLTAIKDASNLIETDNGKLSKEEQNKLLRIINKQAQTLLIQVSSILDAAKIENGRFPIEKKPSDLKKLLEERVEFFSPEAQTKRIIITSEIQDLPQILIDPVRIEEVMNNLISNSLKFTQSGGKITVKATILEKQNITISVSDTGIGIPKEKQQQIFSKFFEVANDFHKGTGLGLYIAKGIIEEHGGQIKLESELGVGTTISFTLPVETPTFAHPIQSPPPHLDLS
ncbi:MAG: HAMP domain-containing sensor histidine kinase [Patescibacteria group bacterium]